MPLPGELMQKLGGGFGYTKIDLADAYNQIKLAPESQRRLALSTHRGVLLQQRLLFRIKSAPGYFQIMENLTHDLPGVAVFQDDMLTNSSYLSVAGAFVRVDIKHSHALYILNIIVGWIYFIVWTVSFYPQAILNYKRKSVVGLNFDFVGYNLIGFLAYGMFNAFLYWDPAIQKLYFHDNPYGVLPVQLNDVVFTIHATFISLFTIGQIYVYERGNQKVSKIGQVIIILMILFILISLIVAGAKAINWLQFLYYLSYVKLFVTFIKYIPQCHMNCVRRSTEGWSIWGVLMDFIGGAFSVLQMFILSYNNDDWKSLFGDPTKFGLGVFSIAFDIIFCLQHYFFQKNKYIPLIQTQIVPEKQ
ncbi:cystinosin [Octopus bimaculoides]|nr:cystinosin [Octopus bimaculoides]|eukprot:XP_014783530.1 PREDICTED: cystinosin-like [Octopus bimaculoides]